MRAIVEMKSIFLHSCSEYYGSRFALRITLSSYLFALVKDELTRLIQDERPLVYAFCRL